MLVAGKDLRIEARSRVTAQQILPFGLVVLLLFAFALDPDRGVLARVAPGLRRREPRLPVRLLPVIAPVLLGASRAWEAAIDGATGDAWPWVALLGLFAVLFTGIGMLAFGPLLEES